MILEIILNYIKLYYICKSEKIFGHLINFFARNIANQIQLNQFNVINQGSIELNADG